MFGPIAGEHAAEAARLFGAAVTNVYGSTETGIVGVASGEDWFTKPGASILESMKAPNLRVIIFLVD